MDQLPLEIIEHILNSPKLSIYDIINFSSSCSYFRNIVISSQTIWKKKINQKWPEAYEIIRDSPVNYYNEIRYIHELRNRAQTLLEAMSPKFYNKFALSDNDLDDWTNLVNETPQSYFYVSEYLMDVCNTNAPIKSIEVVPLKTPGNRTAHFYAIKVLRFMRQQHLSKVWQEFITLPECHQLLEKGAVFVAQWCQPTQNISHQKIAAQLDAIASRVKQRLFLINPDHPIFTTPSETFQRWRREKFEQNQWNVLDSRQVLLAMRDVIYGELGFKGNTDAYYMPQNSLINQVLETKRGLPMTLSIVYESVGRRLGLVFDPISFPAHFLLKFTETPNRTWYYIDVFNDGSIVRKTACPHARTAAPQSVFPVATCRKVVIRIANNLEMATRQHSELSGRVTRLRSVLELLKLVNPQDLTALVTLAKLYMLHNMSTTSLEHHLTTQHFNSPDQANRILQMVRDFSDHNAQDEPQTSITPIERPDNVKYAVGMIMRHATLQYNCVIYDWDPRCLATADWQYDMAVNRLTYKNEQPFYHVLAEDGSFRYVAQENFTESITPTVYTDFMQTNEEIGRHFSHFFENHYVPNAEKEMNFPEDAKVRHKFYQDINLLKYKPQ